MNKQNIMISECDNLIRYLKERQLRLLQHCTFRAIKEPEEEDLFRYKVIDELIALISMERQNKK